MNKVRTSALALGLVTAVGAIWSCGRRRGWCMSAERSIGPEGGTLTVGAVTLEIPAGALLLERTIAVPTELRR